MPLSASGGGGGIHVNVADLPLSMPFDSVKHYEDYIARLHQIPRAFLQTEEVLRAGVNDHLVPVRFIAQKVPGQAEGVMSANPFILAPQEIPHQFLLPPTPTRNGSPNRLRPSSRTRSFPRTISSPPSS